MANQKGVDIADVADAGKVIYLLLPNTYSEYLWILVILSSGYYL